jgi:hypothetical protein
LLLFLQHTEVCKYFRVVTQCLQELQILIILVTYLLGHHHERYLQVQKCISARTEIGFGEKRKTTLVTKTQGQSCLQMQHRLSSSTKRSRAVQVKQTSRWPQGPYATHSNGSAHTAHHSSMSPLLWLHFFPSSTTSTWGGNSTSRLLQISKAWTINHETVIITPKTFYRAWLHQTKWKPRARYVFPKTAQSLSLPIPPTILTNQIYIPPPPRVTLDPRTRWQNMETSSQMHTLSDNKSRATSYKTIYYAAGQMRARVCLFLQFLTGEGIVGRFVSLKSLPGVKSALKSPQNKQRLQKKTQQIDANPVSSKKSPSALERNRCSILPLPSEIYIHSRPNRCSNPAAPSDNSLSDIEQNQWKILQSPKKKSRYTLEQIDANPATSENSMSGKVFSKSVQILH